MLGFTHQSKGTGNKWINNQPSFQPIIITNKLPKQVSPKKQHKVITKANQSLNKFRTTSKQAQRPKQKQVNLRQNQWNTGGIVKGAFDKNLHKNQLAAEQRRLRAQLKKQKQLNHQQVIINEKRIGTKAIKMMRQKDDQIEYLKQMIQKEKQQKAKIDKIYQQKKQQIERQRQALIELERKIQKQGIKQKKVVQEIKRIASPQKDNVVIQRGKSKQLKTGNSYYMTGKDEERYTSQQLRKEFYEEPTQSEALHQKNVMRQKQIDYLINQRENAIKGIPNINYTPTLIPLLSKASYKIISTHVSQIVELLIDDMLQEQVYLLQEIELEQAKEKEEQKSKQILNEYFDMVTDFVSENDEIANKVGKYSTMNFADLYKPKNYPQSQRKSQFQYDDPKSTNLRQVSLEEEFDEDRMQEITNRKDRFIRFVSNFDEYKKQNTDMFAKCTEEIIDEAIMKLAKQLDKGSGEFVDIVFRNQFN